MEKTPIDEFYVNIIPGNATTEQIASFLEALEELHQMMGGGPLEFGLAWTNPITNTSDDHGLSA